MEFFSQTYVSLRGPTGAPQTAADTIERLSDRLSPSTLLADRRAAVLALKGLARDCKQDVGDRALLGLLNVLSNDAEVDADIGKAVLETLNILCDVEDTTSGSKELGFKHTDYVLANEKTAHILFSLMGDTNFYTRFATLQYLCTLLQNRRQPVQSYFLTSPVGARSAISVLEDKREIIRNGEYRFHISESLKSCSLSCLQFILLTIPHRLLAFLIELTPMCIQRLSIWFNSSHLRVLIYRRFSHLKAHSKNFSIPLLKKAELTVDLLRKEHLLVSTACFAIIPPTK